MKKNLLTLLIVALMAPVFAQEVKPDLTPIAVKTSSVKKTTSRNHFNVFPQNVPQSVVELDFIDTAVTVKSSFVSTANGIPVKNRYDRHTQGSIYDMMHIHKDGFIGAVWTVSEEPVTALEARDIVYGFSKDGGKTWEMEYPVVGNHAYWPCYAPWGENGELMVVRVGDEELSGHDGLYIYRRETKGEGDWDVITIENPTTATHEGAVWHRICVSGVNNEYLHVVTGLYVEGRYDPIVYNRTSNGGDTWDFEWTLLEGLAGSDWTHSTINLLESYKWAKPHGDNIAFIMGRLGDDERILKSTANGNEGSWEEILVWDCDFETYVDSGFRVMTGAHVAFDNKGKLHAVMNALFAKPGEEPGSFYFYPYAPYYSLLVYWNEGRGTYKFDEINEKLLAWGEDNFYYFDEEEYGPWKYISGEFNEYVVGGPVSMTDEEGVLIDGKRYFSYNWTTTDLGDVALDNYNRQGVWALPQLTFDEAGRMHMIYLGLVDGGTDSENKPRRHVFHTSTKDEFKTFSKHADLNDFLAIKNNEFSYPCLGGFYDDSHLTFIVQVDPLVGTLTGGNSVATDNVMYAFNVEIFKDPKGMDNVASIPMNIYPNPATSSVRIDFEGKGNIELYNMVGQKVYHIENVTNSHQISLQNMPSGVYFVTVRDGKKTSTQKLIVQ